MSTRRILNTSSRKKRNGMLGWANTTSTGTSQAVSQTPLTVNGSVNAMLVWCPTAMDLNATAGVRNPAQRSSSVIYAKGLSERLRIQTSSGMPWFHRRVCLASRGATPLNSVVPGGTPVTPYGPSLDTSNGIQRLTFNLFVNGSQQQVDAILGLIFKGQQNVDWTDPITAPLDQTRVDVKFDKTWTMQSGNNNGVVRERKLWHPMNKNLYYDEDENGEVESSVLFSTDAKRGMGDYYVIDFFIAGAGGSTTDLLQFQPSSTMYWHEK